MEKIEILNVVEFKTTTFSQLDKLGKMVLNTRLVSGFRMNRMKSSSSCCNDNCMDSGAQDVVQCSVIFRAILELSRQKLGTALRTEWIFPY